jgi:hypothetical protein
MKNISTQYQDLLEGKMTQAQFLRNARMMFPSFVTNHNSFDDSVKILKNKGMLVEGDAVKGAPDKEPTYDYPTQPGKYKKVVQEPEVDEQDGIYPATTLTDIPKEEVSKPIKSKTRPDGLEDIKNNDTKNEMKKVKVVKENLGHNETSSIHPEGRFWIVTYRTADGTKEKSFESEKEARKFYNTLDKTQLNEKSFDEIFADFIENDDPKELITYIKVKGKEAVAKLKAKLAENKDADRKKVAKLMKIELDEARFKKGTDIGKPGKGFEKIAKAGEKQYGSEEAGKKVAGAILKKVLNKESDIKERLKPAITKLVQEVLDEMGPQ